MKKATQSGHSTLNELNITPLLDLVFVLLVIFIITTPQLMNNLEMTLPSAKPPPKLNVKPPPVHKLSITATGVPSLDGDSLPGPTLRVRLQQLKSADPDLRVVVKAEDDTDYQNMVTVLDVLQQLEITKVGLATAATASK